MTSVFVLGGGPDAERDISIASAIAVHAACVQVGLEAQLAIIDRPGPAEIASWDAEVLFPVLHGRFGEGGTLQAMLEAAARPYVGSGPRASRLAMDKMATKLIAARAGIPTPAAVILDPTEPRDPESSLCPLDLPVVIKPIAEGSSVGLHICRTRDDWLAAMGAIATDRAANPDRIYMVERMVAGRELTVSVLCGEASQLTALPIIEILPNEGVYDFSAKYHRTDTHYTVNPDLPDGVARGVTDQALRLCAALGVRHLARVDFLLDTDGQWSLLEANTMPGFTVSSLLPKAAGVHGLPMPELCKHLVDAAVRDTAAQTTA